MKTRPTLAAAVLLAALALAAWLTRWQYIPASIGGSPALYRINRYTGRVDLALGVSTWIEIKSPPTAAEFLDSPK